MRTDEDRLLGFLESERARVRALVSEARERQRLARQTAALDSATLARRAAGWGGADHVIDAGPQARGIVR